LALYNSYLEFQRLIFLRQEIMKAGKNIRSSNIKAQIIPNQIQNLNNKNLIF